MDAAVGGVGVDGVMMVTIATSASVALVYHTVAFGFVYFWHEGTNLFRLFICGMLYRLAVWMLLAVVLLQLWTITTRYSTETKERATHSSGGSSSTSSTSTTMFIVQHSIPLLVSFMTLTFQLYQTRIQIVQGGPYTVPSVESPSRTTTTTKNNNNNNNDAWHFVDRTQKHVIAVTGANTGIGKETVAQLVQALAAPPGATAASSSSSSCLFLLCRSKHKGQAAVNDIVSAYHKTTVPSQRTPTTVLALPVQLHVIECDLTSFASIRLAVTTMLTVESHIDVVINNAGVMMNAASYTENQHETCLQANFLGPFLLTKLILLSRCSVSLDHPISSTKTTTTTSSSAMDETDHTNNHGSSPLLIVNVTSSTYRLAVSTFDATNLDALQCRSGHTRTERGTTTPTVTTTTTSTSTDTGHTREPPTKQQQNEFTIFGQYAATKWCNILHTVFLEDTNFVIPHNMATTSSDTVVPLAVLSRAVHPGLVRTDVVRNMPWFLKLPNTLFASVLRTLQKTPAQGAWCTLHVVGLALRDMEALPTTDGTSCGSVDRYYWVNRHPQALNMDLNEIRHQARLLWDWALTQVDLTPNELQKLSTMTQMMHAITPPVSTTTTRSDVAASTKKLL